MQNDGMLINHKWLCLKIPRDHISFVITTGPGWKGLHCWDAESNPKLLWPGSDHLVTHPLQKSGQAGHGTNSEVFEKSSRSIIAYYLNLIFASSEFILHLLCGTILGLRFFVSVLYVQLHLAKFLEVGLHLIPFYFLETQSTELYMFLLTG